MAVVISLDAWRSQRREPGRRATREASAPQPRDVTMATRLAHDGDCARLQRAVDRLDLLIRPDTDRDRLAPDVERDMLTIVGELAMGWLDQAADRAERLCDQLIAHGE
jgi:hypothetical protein